jgi:uncharacterized protein YbjT (DUF2867 family)
MSDDAVLVIGATGRQGSAAARALLARGRPVHALVRDPRGPAARELLGTGARLVAGDLDDPESLRSAMIAVSGVFLVLTPMTGPKVTATGVAAEERRGLAVADLAARTGIRHLVYSSVAGADQHTGVPHIESKGRIEAYLRGLGLPVTVLRPVFFMENFTSHTRPVVTNGELVVSLALHPDTALQLVATRDVGEFAAMAFDRPETFIGRSIVVAGDDLPAAVIAERLGRARGLPARFQRVPFERVHAFDPEVASMFEWFDSGKGERADLPALRALHPDLYTVDTWARAVEW